MLESIACILVLIWVLGTVSTNTLGGYIHILLLVALFIMFAEIITHRREA